MNSQPDSADDQIARLVAFFRERASRGEGIAADELQVAIEALSRTDAINGPPPATVSLQPGFEQTVSLRLQAPNPSSPSSEVAPTVDRAPRASIGGTLPAGWQFGDYEIVRKIAQGGMGVVYEARQRSLQRTVALKMIRAADLADNEEIARFYAEAEAAAGLRHPHIVAVYEVGRWGDAGHYFTMDYIAGPSLATVLQQQTLAPQRVAALLVKVSRAIHFAHERGVLHRDLKPSNILLGEDDEPRVADFGLAKRLQSDSGHTIDGTVLGTPSYMPPEQARGEQRALCPASDVYSLGAVLYECLTGRPPFVASNLADLLRQVVHDEPVPPSRLVPRLPRDLETICLKCLEKDPAKRYPAAAALATDLDRYLRDEPIEARPISSVERARKFIRRNPAWAALGGVLAIATLLVLAISLWSNHTLSLKNAALDQALRDVKTESKEAKKQSKLATEKSELAAERYHSLRRTSYATSIKQADSYYSAIPPNLARADEMLQSLLPPTGETDLRGPEWRFLQRAVRQDNLQFQSSDQIRALNIAPNGKLQLHCHRLTGDYLLFLTSPVNGKRERKFFAMPFVTGRVIFSRNGEFFLALGSQTGLQLRCTAEPDQVIATLASETPMPDEQLVHQATISDDGALVAWVSTAGEAHVWSRAEEREIKTVSTKLKRSGGLLISPDNRYVMTFGSGGVVLDLHQDQTIDLKGVGHMLSAAFSPDSKSLAIGYGRGDFDLVSLQPGMQSRAMSRLKFSSDIDHLEFTADGTKIIAGCPNCLLAIVDVTKNVASILRGHRSSVTAVRRGTGPHQFYTAGASGEVLVWDDRTEEQRATVLELLPEDEPMSFATLSYSPNGDYLLCGTRVWALASEAEQQGSLIFYDTRDLSLRKRWKTPVSVRACSFSPGGQEVCWLERVKENPQATFRRRPFAWQDQAVESAPEDLTAHAAVIAAGGQILVSDKGSIRLHQPDAEYWPGQPRRIKSSRILELVASPDGHWLGSIDSGYMFRLWNVGAKRQVAWSPIDILSRAIAFSADGSLAAWAAPDRNVLELGRNQKWSTPPVNVQWEPHHRAVVYNLQKDKVELIVSGHADPVESLALSADGRRLLTGDTTGLVKLWDTATGQELLSFSGSASGIFQVAIHPQGRQFATLGTNGRINVWHCE